MDRWFGGLGDRYVKVSWCYLIFFSVSWQFSINNKIFKIVWPAQFNWRQLLLPQQLWKTYFKNLEIHSTNSWKFQMLRNFYPHFPPPTQRNWHPGYSLVWNHAQHKVNCQLTPGFRLQLSPDLAMFLQVQSWSLVETFPATDTGATPEHRQNLEGSPRWLRQGPCTQERGSAFTSKGRTVHISQGIF